MTKTMSIFLDALRFLAAMVVVFAHFSQPMFTSFGPDKTVYGFGAVAVFFVLSGFVISYVVQEKEGTALNYASARIARIYSVLVPAIVLSSLVLAVGRKMDAAYMLHWIAPAQLHPLLNWHAGFLLVEQTIFPATFLNSFRETWRDMYPPLDSPIWSLGYEVGYYILFGVAVFGKGTARVLLLVVVAVLLGPDLLRLLPVWLSGVWLYKSITTLRTTPWRARLLGGLCLLGVAAACVFWTPYLDWVGLHHGRVLEFCSAEGTAPTTPGFITTGAWPHVFWFWRLPSSTGPLDASSPHSNVQSAGVPGTHFRCTSFTSPCLSCYMPRRTTTVLRRSLP